MKGLCLVPLQNDNESYHQVATRLLIAEVQSLVLCYKDTKACSTTAIGQVALRIVAFIFNVNYRIGWENGRNLNTLNSNRMLKYALNCKINTHNPPFSWSSSMPWPTVSLL